MMGQRFWLLLAITTATEGWSSFGMRADGLVVVAVIMQSLNATGGTVQDGVLSFETSYYFVLRHILGN